MRTLLTFTALFLFHLASVAMTSVKVDTLNLPYDLDSVYKHFEKTNKSSVFEGYTIQLFSGSRTGALEVRAQFLNAKLGDEPRLVYREPNFKLQVGSFPDLLTAEKRLVEVRKVFPNAFVLQATVPLYPIGRSTANDEE